MKKATTKPTKVNLFTRGNTVKSNENGVEVLVTNQLSAVKGHFWGVITNSTDKNAIGVLNHFSKEKFALETGN